MSSTKYTNHVHILQVIKLDTIWDRELVIVAIITGASLVLLVLIYLVQPTIEHYFRKSVSSIVRKSGTHYIIAIILFNTLISKVSVINGPVNEEQLAQLEILTLPIN